MNELNKVDGDIVYSGFKFRKNGLEAIGTPDFTSWQECGEFIKKAEGAVQFWLGDWIRYGEGHYGEMYSQALEDTGLEYGTLRDDKWISDKVEMSRRHDNLSFDHHRQVADLAPEEQTKLLDLAESKHIKSKEFRQVVKEYKHKKEQALLPPINTNNFSQKVLEGDCLTRLKELSDKSIDMIYVDPPYNVGVDEWDKFSDYEFGVFTIEWLKQCFRVLKDKSHLFIHFPSQKATWMENLIVKEFGLAPDSRIIWNYRNLVKGRDAKNKFLSTYQPILHYSIGGKELNFDLSWGDERFDVWTIAAPQSNFEEGKEHITQKPLELMERLVKFGSFEGETVLDPMAGSGTTGVAAFKNKRDFVLIEREPKYIEIIHRRLNDVE